MLNSLWLFCQLIYTLFVYFRLKFILLLLSNNYLMIRQSLVDERVSALHLHALQSTGDNDNDISKASSRRVPAPVASRIVITKNASLISTGDELNINSSSSPTQSPTPMVDPRSRVELLERNLRYVQQQHEITLVDLHNEISRLQKENRGLFIFCYFNKTNYLLI